MTEEFRQMMLQFLENERKITEYYEKDKITFEQLMQAKRENAVNYKPIWEEL